VRPGRRDGRHNGAVILSQPKWWAVAAVWLGTLIAAIVLAAAVSGTFVWVALALTAEVAVVVGIVVQLAVGEQVGFVERLVATACGSFLLVLLVALVRLVAGA
jgi:hypothetical protein